MNITSLRIYLLRASTLLALASIVTAADPATIRAVLQSTNERKAAPEFALKDSSGKTVRLKKYRGKVVLLNFWATWCTGCKKEMPWFSEFQRMYAAKGLAVVGISMDEGGWNTVRPFLAQAKASYAMLLGDGQTAQVYGITNLPDTFLIDRQGRMAAAYMGGLVDRDNVEANIRELLFKR